MRPLFIGEERHPLAKIDSVVVHCTDGSLSADRDDIDRFHKSKSWEGIGYHWVVLRDGTVQPGRAETRVGAHARGWNDRSIGVVWVGSARRGKITPAQTVNLIELLATICDQYNLTAQAVWGHCETPQAAGRKSCPDIEDMDLLRVTLAKIMEERSCSGMRHQA